MNDRAAVVAILVAVYGAGALIVHLLRWRSTAEEDAGDDSLEVADPETGQGGIGPEAVGSSNGGGGDGSPGAAPALAAIGGAVVLGAATFALIAALGEGVGADGAAPIVVGAVAAAAAAIASEALWARSESSGGAPRWGTGGQLGWTRAEDAWARMGGAYTDVDDADSLLPAGCFERPSAVVGTLVASGAVMWGVDRVDSAGTAAAVTVAVLVAVAGVGILVGRLGRLSAERRLRVATALWSGLALGLIVFGVLDAALEPDEGTAASPPASTAPDAEEDQGQATTTTSTPEPVAIVSMPETAYQLQITAATIETPAGIEQYEIDDLDIADPRAAVQVADGAVWFDLGPGVWDGSQCVGLFATGSDVAAVLAGPGCPDPGALPVQYQSAVIDDRVIVSDDGTDVAFAYDLPDATDDFMAVVIIETPDGLVSLGQATSVFDLPPAGAVDFPDTEVGEIVLFEANGSFEAFTGGALR